MIALGRPWTDAEVATLRAVYPSEGIDAARAALPGRTDAAIYHKVTALKLCVRRPRWTPREDKLLRLEWGERSIQGLAAMFGRPPKGVYEHAKELGLPLGCPDGYEYLSAAAARTGFHTDQLRRVLGAAGVRIHRGMSRPEKRRAPGTFYVEPDAVDEAIAKWHACEDVTSAARRRGIPDDRLRAWLRKAGLADKRRKKKEHWRIPSEVIDRVVADELRKRALMTLAQAAAVHGMKHQSLSKWLKDADVTPTGKPWRLEPDVVARVVAEHRSRKTCRARGETHLEAAE